MPENGTPLLAWWVHDLDPVLLPIYGPIALRWYGLAYVAGFLAFVSLFRLYAKRGRSPWDAPALESLMTWGIGGVLLGGRLGYMLLYNLPAFLANPLILLDVTGGGMAFHGGLAGAFLGMLYACRRRHLPILATGDLCCSAAAPGLFFGRIANFINGELWGHPTKVSWGVIFPEAPMEPRGPIVWVEELGTYASPRHPSQLYEAALEGILLGLYMQWRFWIFGKKLPAGQLAGEFIIGYGILRSIAEIYRVPDASLILGLSRGTFYSLAMIAIGTSLILYARRKKFAPEPT